MKPRDLRARAVSLALLDLERDEPERIALGASLRSYVHELHQWPASVPSSAVDWCCAYVASLVDRARAGAFVGADGAFHGASGHLRWKESGGWKWPVNTQLLREATAPIGLEEAEPGDVVVFQWPGSKASYGDHVGVYVAHDEAAGTVSTIDGNVGTPSRVAHRVRPLAFVVAVCRLVAPEDLS